MTCGRVRTKFFFFKKRGIENFKATIMNDLHVNEGILPRILDHKGNLMHKQEVGVVNHEEEAQHTPTFST